MDKKLHLMEQTEEFLLYYFKTEYCPFSNSHNRNSCVYAHNVQDFRRNPKEINYKAIECQNWNRTGKY